jgi:hypothetical protein
MLQEAFWQIRARRTCLKQRANALGLITLTQRAQNAGRIVRLVGGGIASRDYCRRRN